MIIGYMLFQLAKAVKREDYATQTIIANFLLPYEAIGKVTNQDVIDVILNV